MKISQNAAIIAYIGNRYFTGFTVDDDKRNGICLSSQDGTIISILARAKIVKDNADEVCVELSQLLERRSAIKKAVRDLRCGNEQEAIDLMDFLGVANAFSDPAIKQRIADGFVMFADLPVLLPCGTEVIATTGQGTVGGVVDSVTEVQTMFGTYYAVMLSIIIPTKKGTTVGKLLHRVPFFDSKTAINKLSIRVITADEKTALRERGLLLNRFFTGAPSVANYTGLMTIPNWSRDRVFGADGRVMVDALNFAQADAETYNDMMHRFNFDKEEGAGGELPYLPVAEADLWRCYNRVPGFSMRIKRWGWLEISGLRPVEWREDAFDQLVLEPRQKQSILHLVKHYRNSFSDFIDGKSGGLVFLLHGAPGNGKTLSAEAVAETLRRPLYTVSVGELGVTPEDMEERLRTILDLACQWNAVLLLDEADIFMEARDTVNVQRNAMVSILLRQLEYYAGVMFLTTNRVATFDQAFFSRVSLAISYPKLEESARASVWKNVLNTAKVDTRDINIAQLARYDVNGRNIKTAVRIAQTMAAGNGRDVVEADLTDILKLTMNFSELIG